MEESLIVQKLAVCLMGRWWVEKEKMGLIEENVWSEDWEKKGWGGGGNEERSCLFAKEIIS